MKFFLLFINFWFFIFQIGKAQNQEPVGFDRLTIKDGLSHNNVRTIMQDSKGFLWFGSYGGIDRYDGHSFKSFKYEYGNPNSLSNNHVIDLMEDSEGMIWAATSSNGLCMLDPSTERFTRYLEQRDQPHGLKCTTVTCIIEDRHKRLWVGTSEGLHLLDRKTGKFFRFTSVADDINTISTNSWIWSLFEDKAGTIWVGTLGEGLNRVNLPSGINSSPEAFTFTRYRHNPKEGKSLSNNRIHAIFQDHQGVLWLATGNGLNRFDPEKNNFFKYLHEPLNPNSISNNIISSIAEDYEGNLWVLTHQGLNKLDSTRTNFTLILQNLISPGTPGYGPLLVDRTGILWTGSEDTGIYKFDPNRRHLNFFQHDPANPNSLSNNEVKSICEDQEGNIWIGTLDGLNAYNPLNDSYKHFKYDPLDLHSLSHNHIQSLLEDRDGNLWIGVGDGFNTTGSICMLERNSEKFTCYNPYSEKPLYEIIFAIIEDHLGLIWFATSNGIKSFDRTQEEWVHYPFDPENPTGISGPWARTICEDRKGNIWIGIGSGGLNMLDRKTGIFKHYLNDRNTTISDIHSVREDSRGNLWIGTDGGGLYLFDPDTGHYEVFTEKDGLINNGIHNILEDDEGFLWLNTNKGLCRFSPDDRTFTGFDFAEGEEGNHFVSGNLNMGACFKGKDGKLYFGGKHGFTMFHPRELRSNTHIPPIEVTQVRLFDEPLPGIHQGREIELNYNQNFISFDFAALNFTNPHKNQYAYRLENFDQDWIFSGNRRYASYTNLNPGNYTFRAKGSNNDGFWNEEGAVIKFVIYPPWWRTWWAYLGYGLLLLMGLFLWQRETLRRERLRAGMHIKQMESDKLREMDTLKSHFFSNVSHEFRTPLALIQGTVEKLTSKEQPGDERLPAYGLIHRSSERLLQLVSQLLDLSRLEAGKLRLQPEPGEVISFLKLLASSFASLFENKSIRFSYHLPHEPLWVQFDGDKLEKIISNLLSNACKFTPAGGEVVLEVNEERTTSLKTGLFISVHDTGVGIPEVLVSRIFERFFQADFSATKSYEGAGIGLALTKELVELHGGTIRVESRSGKGTIFNIFLPLQVVEQPQVNHPEDLLISHKALQEQKYLISPDSVQENHQEILPIKDQTVVLVVEDNSDLRHFITESLPKEYAVFEAEDGNMGWKKALEQIPDLIISDVMMPGMDGISLCKELKTDERTSHIAVILLTAKADSDSKMAGLETGADDYLTKPFRLEELQVRVHNQLQHRFRLRKRFSRSLTLQPAEISVNSVDERFLQKVMEVLETHLANTSFDVEMFSRETGMSRAHLHRKLKSLTDHSPGDLIRNHRLKRAASLLQQKSGNISEVAYAVGYNSLTYFAKSFRNHFGQTPSEFVSEVGKNQMKKV